MSDIIVRQLTPDGLIGFDKFGQLQAKEVGAEHTMSWIISDVREKTCVICNHGWELNHKSFKDQHYWHNRKVLIHESCYKRYLMLSEWEQVYFNVCSLNLAFPEGLKERKNEYGGAWNLPWYEFEWNGAETFTIVIGRRKRVWHMEIQGPTPGYPGLPDLDYRMAEKCFSEERVTKEFGPTSVMVHAWTDEKMLAYLKKFVRILGLEKPVEKVAE